MKTTFLSIFILLISISVFAQTTTEKTPQKPTEKRLKSAGSSQYYPSAELGNTIKTMQTYMEQNGVPTLVAAPKTEMKETEMTQAITSIKEWKGTKYKGIYR
jgi:hypothetical protein